MGYTIFKHELPPTPDAAVVVTVYAGLAPVRVHPQNQATPPTINYEQPRFQVKARGNKADIVSARDLIQVAYIALSHVKNTVLNGNMYQSIEPEQAPFFLRKDENDRPEFVFNCGVYRSYSEW